MLGTVPLLLVLYVVQIRFGTAVRIRIPSETAVMEVGTFPGEHSFSDSISFTGVLCDHSMAEEYPKLLVDKSREFLASLGKALNAPIELTDYIFRDEDSIRQHLSSIFTIHTEFLNQFYTAVFTMGDLEMARVVLNAFLTLVCTEESISEEEFDELLGLYDANLAAFSEASVTEPGYIVEDYDILKNSIDLTPHSIEECMEYGWEDDYKLVLVSLQSLADFISECRLTDDSCDKGIESLVAKIFRFDSTIPTKFMSVYHDGDIEHATVIIETYLSGLCVMSPDYLEELVTEIVADKVTSQDVDNANPDQDMINKFLESSAVFDAALLDSVYQL